MDYGKCFDSMNIRPILCENPHINTKIQNEELKYTSMYRKCTVHKAATELKACITYICTYINIKLTHNQPILQKTLDTRSLNVNPQRINKPKVTT